MHTKGGSPCEYPHSVWSHLCVNGGYSLKLHYVRTPSSANYYPIVVDVTNSSGQMNIYIKGRTFIEVLKGFAHEVMKHFKDLTREVNLPLFYDVISNSEFVDIRKVGWLFEQQIVQGFYHAFYDP